MTKPTPGPMTIERNTFGDSIVLTKDRVPVAQFFNKFSFGIGIPEAEANARAWVEGREACERLERIRRVLRDEPLLPNERLQAIDKILDEAKP